MRPRSSASIGGSACLRALGESSVHNPQSAIHNRSGRRAAALILVLWAIAVLALVAGGLSFVIRQDVAIAGIESDRLTAHWLARAGVERAMAAVMDDARTIDTEQDLCMDDPTAFGQVSLKAGAFSVLRDGYEDIPNPWYGAGDESAKLNINAATREQLMRLPHMTEAIAAAIIDWRSTGDEFQPDGAGAAHYAALPHPYVIRNGPLRTVRELLLVRGITPELFYGEDTNASGLLDPNEDDGGLSDPPDNADGRLDRGWYAYVTVYTYEKNENGLGRKRLNVNKADSSSLAALGLERWAAESIVKARENNEFNTLSDLLEVRRDSSIIVDPASDPDINARGDDEQDVPVTRRIFQRIVDDLTLSDDQVLPGRININTAPLPVLRTLPGLEEELAVSILQRRQGGLPYYSIGDLLDVSGMDREKFARIENLVTVRSNVFRIHSHGESASGLARAAIECIVDRGGEVPRVLYWLESAP